MPVEFAREKMLNPRHRVPAMLVDAEPFSEIYNHNNASRDQRRLEKQHRQQQRQRQQMRRQHQQQQHVHFDEYVAEQQQEELEVSCEQNPTQLFILMNRQLWDTAIAHLRRKPIEAHTWVYSLYPGGDGYRWRNLPLHLACLHGPEPVPLQFIEALIGVYPGAAQCLNHEGNLPIHLACDCVDLSPRFGLQAEGILITLIKAFPECLMMGDGLGRRPIEILEEKGVRALRFENVVGRGVGVIKYMKTQARIMTEAEQQRQEKVETQQARDRAEGQQAREKVRAERIKQHWAKAVEVKQAEEEELRRERVDVQVKSLVEAELRREGVGTHQAKGSEDHQRRREKAREARGEEAGSRKRLGGIDVPESSDEAATAIGEKIDLWNITRSSSLREISNHALAVVEDSFHLSPSNKIPQKHSGSDVDGSDRARVGVIETTAHQPMPAEPEPHQSKRKAVKTRPQQLEIASSPVSPFNPMRTITPHNANILPLAAENFDPFHPLETELASMRNTHQSISQLLSAKTKSESDLQEKLLKLEAEHEKLKTEFTNLTNEHSGILAELEDNKKALVGSNYELKIMRSKEKAVSSELALKLQAEGSQTNEISSLKSELEKERGEKLSFMEKLGHQIRANSDLKETSRERDQLSIENKQLATQLTQKNKQLHETKAKETTLLGLLSKMHSMEGDLDERKDLQMQLAQKIEQLEETKAKELKARGHNEKLARDNSELQSQLARKNKALQELETKELKSRGQRDKIVEESNKLRLQCAQKIKDLHGTRARELKSKTENEALAKEIVDLKMQLAQKSGQLEETKSKETNSAEQLSKMQGLLAEMKGNKNSNTEELHAKNLALREVTLKAIKAVCVLQQRVVHMPLTSDCNENSLNKLLDDAECAKPGSSRKRCKLDASESLKLLHPIMEDAQKLQQDTVERSQQLLQLSHITKNIIKQIPSIHHNSFAFEDTLGVLEDTITSNFQVLELLSEALETKEMCKSKLMLLFDQKETRKMSFMLAEDGNSEVGLYDTAMSSVRIQSATLISVVDKHIDKLESLAKTVSTIPRIKKLNLDSEKKDNLRKQLNMVDEVTTMLQKALSTLVQDAKQIKVANHNIHTVCENEKQTDA